MESFAPSTASAPAAMAENTLAAAIPDVSLQADPSLGSAVQVVLGSGFSGARPVHVGEVVVLHHHHRSKTPGTSAADLSCAP